MTSQYEMIKQSLIDGLKQCNYDVNRLEPIRPKNKLFGGQWQDFEISNALSSAKFVVGTLKNNNKYHKYTRDELLNDIDEESAHFGMMSTMTQIKIFLKLGKDMTKIVKEARDTLDVLRKHGSIYLKSAEREFKETIGEI